MRRLASALASLLVLAAAILGLARWLDRLSGRAARLESAPAGPVLDAPRVVSIHGPRRGGTLLLDGSPPPPALLRDPRTLALGPGDLAPGLHEITFRQRFVGHADRAISLGLLAGPFAEPGASVPCALRVTLRQTLLDAFAGRLAALLRERAEAVRGLPAIARSEARVVLVERGLDARATLTFSDGSELHALLPLALAPTPGAPLQVRRRDEVQVEVTGTLGALASLKGGGILAALSEMIDHPERGLSGALEAARQAGNRMVGGEVQGALDGWLARANERLAALVPATLEAGLFGVEVAATLSPCGRPKVRPGRWLALRYGLKLAVASEGARPPRTAERVPGPPLRPGADLGPGPAPGRAPLTVTLSRAGLDALLDAAWRSGALGALAARPEILRRVNARLAGRASFALRGVELALPPQVEPAGDGLSLRAAEVVAHLEEGTTPVHLVLAGTARLVARVEARRLVLEARVRSVRGSCQRQRGEVEVRRACYPELIAALAEVLVRSEAGHLHWARARALGLSPARVRVQGARATGEGIEVAFEITPTE